jgi:hypothetical protein
VEDPTRIKQDASEDGVVVTVMMKVKLPTTKPQQKLMMMTRVKRKRGNMTMLHMTIAVMKITRPA